MYRAKEYKKEKYIATYNDTAFSGIGIIGIEHGVDEKVVYQTIVGNTVSKINKTKIYYTSKGKPYFNVYNKRYKLDDFMKV